MEGLSRDGEGEGEGRLSDFQTFRLSDFQTFRLSEREMAGVRGGEELQIENGELQFANGLGRMGAVGQGNCKLQTANWLGGRLGCVRDRCGGLTV